MSTLTLGAGLAPAGSSDGGFGAPATATAFVSPVLTTDLVNTQSRDFTYDINGNRTQGATTNQLVYFALQTVRNSSAIAGFGLLASPSLITSSLIATRTAAYADALARLIAGNLVQLVGVSIAVSPQVGRVIETVKWRDLTLPASATPYEYTAAY